MRTLLALIAVFTLAACGTATVTTGTRLAGPLTIAEVTQAFRDHGLTVGSGQSQPPLPSSAPFPVERRRVANSIYLGVDLFAFATEQEARDFSKSWPSATRRTPHRNIVMDCSSRAATTCQEYYAVLVSLR